MKTTLDKNEALALLRKQALAQFDNGSPDVYEPSSYDETRLESGNREWLVVTDSEANDAVKTAIQESAWAFNASFLAAFTHLPEEVFTALQPQYENSNDAVLALLEHGRGNGFAQFVEEVVSADGRGHFLSQYDGEENEETISASIDDPEDHPIFLATDGSDRITFYIYRLN